MIGTILIGFLVGIVVSMWLDKRIKKKIVSNYRIEEDKSRKHPSVMEYNFKRD